jgi:hypothetical protein
MLQLGMLFIPLLVASLVVWDRARRRLRADGAGLGPKVELRRLRVWGRARVAEIGQIARARLPRTRDRFTPAEHQGIARRRGRHEAQLAGLPRDLPRPRRLHVVGDAEDLQVPIRVYSLSMRESESESALDAVVTVDWKPVQSRGLCEASARRADPDAVGEAPERAPRGANRDAVLRAVAARAGVTMRELGVATDVNPSSLRKLVRTLTVRGELEQIMRPNGQTAYVLVRTHTRGGGGQAPHDAVRAGEGSE